ncbi:MAG: hypothetical protein QNL04_08080 [SAR324 cluster bacterium]|nr:hypothetical protein [SAR324 cluster bacterium]
MKEKLKAWFVENEDRLEELKDSDAAAQFGQIELAEFKKLKAEIIIEMVMENVTDMPDLNFHAQKNLFPYPSSEQLQTARERLGLGRAKMKH